MRLSLPNMTEAAEKRVTSAELYFDLVFVFAVTAVSARLRTDHDGLGLLRAFVAFVPVYWMWVGTAVRTNILDVQRPSTRLQVFAVGLSGLFMALALPSAYEDLGLVFAFAYWGGRSVIAIPVLRARRALTPYLISMVLTGPLLVVGALLDPDLQLAVWAAAAALDLATPSLLRNRLRGMTYDASHLSERFGLFVLIALGESVVAIGLGAQEHLTLAAGFAVVAAFALSTGLWWVYFHYAADAVRHALATAEVQLDITRLVLSYGHLSFIASIVCVAVGLHESVAHPTDRLPLSGAGFLVGGTALYLATFGYTRWMMFHQVSSTRLVAAGVTLLVLPLAFVVPAVASLTALAVIVAVLNLEEWRRVERPRLSAPGGFA